MKEKNGGVIAISRRSEPYGNARPPAMALASLLARPSCRMIPWVSIDWTEH